MVWITQPILPLLVDRQLFGWRTTINIQINNFYQAGATVQVHTPVSLLLVLKNDGISDRFRLKP
jgi:hypothetical protein